MSCGKQAVRICHYLRLFVTKTSVFEWVQRYFSHGFAANRSALFTCQFASPRPSEARQAVNNPAKGACTPSIYNGQKAPFLALTSVGKMKRKARPVHNSRPSRDLPSRKNISSRHGFVVSGFYPED